MARPRCLPVFHPSIGLLILACLAAAQSSIATTVVRFNDQQLVGVSSLIVEGRVVEVRSEWNRERTQIHTTVQLDVSRTFKGATTQPGKLTLRLLGGRVGDTIQELVDGPTFAVDQDVIIFLEKDVSHPIPISGFNQGKLTIVTDAAGRSVVAERGIPHDDFIDSIQSLVASERGR